MTETGFSRLTSALKEMNLRKGDGRGSPGCAVSETDSETSAHSKIAVYRGGEEDPLRTATEPLDLCRRYSGDSNFAFESDRSGTTTPASHSATQNFDLLRGEDGSCNSSFEVSWQPAYLEAACALMDCLTFPPGSDTDAQLAGAAARVYGHLDSLICQKAERVKDGEVELILAGVFYQAQQRLVLWCGGLRPSDVICSARIGMAADGVQLPQSTASAVDAVLSECLVHQKAITEGMEDATQRLARLKAVSRYVKSQASRGAPAVDLRPKVQALKDTMAQHLLQAEELRKQSLQELVRLLSPRQLSYALLAPMDILQLD